MDQSVTAAGSGALSYSLGTRKKASAVPTNPPMSDNHKPAFGEMNLSPTSHPAYPPMLLKAVMVIHFIMTAFPPR